MKNAKAHAQLISTAAELVRLGVEVENARNQLKRLVDRETAYESPEMLAAVERFQDVDRRWKELEKEYLALSARLNGR